MPNFPVRNLGGTGIITDAPAYDLPPNALSAGVNIRFENGKITRGPVFRDVYTLPSDFTPDYLFSIPPVTEGSDALISVGNSGQKVYAVTGGTTIVDVTPETTHTVNTDYPWSHTFLGSVAYLNQKDGVPLMRRQSDLKFQPLEAWPEDYRCASLRSYKDYLIAMGVSKAGTEYPTMVKWSDFATFGAPPSSWAIDDTTNSAGENVINEMRTPIIDGLTLRDSFVIYCQSEVWVMDYIGGNFMFRFRKLFDRCGIINQNCVIQVDGLHYVFDRNDIYVNDGSTKRSIASGLVKDFIFDNLDQSKRNLCFVTHDPRLSEIHFAYPSTDALAGFSTATTGCNRIAVFNYRVGTWSFYDAPNVIGAAPSVIPTGISYEDMAATDYPSAVEDYREQGGTDKETYTIFASVKDVPLGLTESRLLGLDLVSSPRLDKPICDETVKPSLIERVGIDLDEAEVPLSAYKVIHTLYPQLSITGTGTADFQFGATDVVRSSPTWSSNLTFDPSITTKVDTGRIAGRYLSWRLHYDGDGDFALSGFDAKLVTRGRRG